MATCESGGGGSVLIEVGREMKEQVLDKYKVEDSKREALPRQRLFLGMEACTKKQEVQDTKMEKIFGQESSFGSESTICSVGKSSMKLPRKNER